MPCRPKKLGVRIAPQASIVALKLGFVQRIVDCFMRNLDLEGVAIRRRSIHQL